MCFGFSAFVAPSDEVGVFYSDNADSLRLACREVGWRQNNSIAYVSKWNAVAKRNLLSVLEGTITLNKQGFIRVLQHDTGAWRTTFKIITFLELWSCVFLACHLMHAQVEIEDATKRNGSAPGLVWFVVCFVGLTFGIPYL